jgi:hypothetical protein
LKLKICGAFILESPVINYSQPSTHHRTKAVVGR